MTCVVNITLSLAYIYQKNYIYFNSIYIINITVLDPNPYYNYAHVYDIIYIAYITINVYTLYSNARAGLIYNLEKVCFLAIPTLIHY